MRIDGGKTSRNATKQANKVFPVVKTSSTITRCLIAGRSFFAALKASATFLAFPSMSSLVWVFVRLIRLRMSVLIGMPVSDAMPEAITSA